jgi:hypothetical protein
MRINGLTGAATQAAPSAPRRSASGTFQLSESDEKPGASQASALRSVASMDALLALQGVEDLMERRKRAVKQGRKALDVLERLKISVLDGTVDSSTIGNLKSAAEGLKGSTGDPGLDAVLAEIELRVEVELAKAGRS